MKMSQKKIYLPNRFKFKWNFILLALSSWETLVTCDENPSDDIKETKAKVTIMLYSNAAGTHKCTPLVVKVPIFEVSNICDL